MGIIQTQSIKNTIVNFIGTFIGIISILFVVPLEKEIYGYAQWLYSTALVLTPVIGLGMPTLVIKYYPEFVQRGRERNFLAFTLIFGLLLLVVISTVICLLLPYILDVSARLGFQTEKIVANGGYIFALSVLLFFIACLISYTSTQKKIVIPDLINNVGFKIALPVFILLYYFGWIDEPLMALALIFFFFINFLFLLIYSVRLTKTSARPDLAVIRESGWRNFVSYLGFASLNSISYYLVFRLDIIMIGLLINDAAVGIYAIVMVMANVINIPTVAVSRIASPIIAVHWQKNEVKEIDTIYKKSSLNIAFASLIIFSLIILNLEDLIRIMPGDLNSQELSLIFLLLGGGKLFDVISSLNTQIITYSAKYRYNLYFLLIQAILNVIFNYYFISRYGVSGAALATLLSLVIFNILKYLFLRIQFKMDFITSDFLKTVFTGGLILIACYLIPLSLSPVTNMIFRTVLFLLLYLFSVILLRYNPDVLNMISGAWSKYRK